MNYSHSKNVLRQLEHFFDHQLVSLTHLSIEIDMMIKWIKYKMRSNFDL